MSGTIDAYLPIIYIALGAVGSLFMWLVIGPVMTGYGFKRLVRKAAEGDPKSLETFYHVGDLLIKWAAEERIPTGEKIKVATDKVDEEGKPIYKEVNEVLSPIQLMARTIGNYVLMKFKGSIGGTKNQVKQMFVDSMAETGGGPSPAALQALSRGNIGPLIAEVGLPYLTEALNKRKGGINNQSAGDYLK
jgi:hypothetical protein